MLKLGLWFCVGGGPYSTSRGSTSTSFHVLSHHLHAHIVFIIAMWSPFFYYRFIWCCFTTIVTSETFILSPVSPSPPPTHPLAFYSSGAIYLCVWVDRYRPRNDQVLSQLWTSPPHTENVSFSSWRPGLWIQIHWIWIWIQKFCPIWIRIQGYVINFERRKK